MAKVNMYMDVEITIPNPSDPVFEYMDVDDMGIEGVMFNTETKEETRKSFSWLEVWNRLMYEEVD